MFSAKKRLFAVARVIGTFTDADLAEHLWGTAVDGRPFKYIMGLEDPYAIDRAAVELLAAIGEGGKDYIQDFRVLDELQSERALRFLAIRSDYSEAEDAGVTPSAGPTDARTLSKRRLEQRELALRVKSDAAGICALCLREFDSEFLVAAHIKLRAQCTDDERHDFQHIAMAACRLGCDQLFELGLVTVTASGALQGSALLEQSPVLSEYFQQHLSGNQCAKWSAGSSVYFAWHRQNIFRKRVSAI
ncbi:hypothetical protein ACX80H_03905 [Arthrobacter sp. MDT2-2]